MGRVISTISGGKASGYVAWWALQHYPKDDVVLYFNDTGWEHPDLHRFLNDLSVFLDHPIVHDNDGRDVEMVAYDQHAIPNNRLPFCSHTLKAQRLQRYCQDGDVLLFGIGANERHRAKRIKEVYEIVSVNRAITVSLRFPLIEFYIDDIAIAQFYKKHAIETPELYKLGFSHNNCGGGCVRSSKKQWLHLLQVQPETYAERERFEREIAEHFGKRMTILKDMSLERLRLQYQAKQPIELGQEPDVTDCIGICSTTV